MKQKCACLVTIHLQVNDKSLDLSYDIPEFPDDIELVKSFTTHVTQDILNAIDVTRQKDLETIKEAEKAALAIAESGGDTIHDLEKQVEALESELKMVKSGVFAKTLKESLRRNEEVFMQKAEEAASKAVDGAAQQIVDRYTKHMKREDK